MTAALFARFPGTASLPLAGIAAIPTPLEPVAERTYAGIGSLAIRRDDLTSPRYGGNKTRKLDFLLAAARAEGRRTVLTFGAYGSNHCLATAVHARALGLEPHLVLSPQEPGPFAPRTLLAHAALGSVIHLTQGWDGSAVAEEASYAIAERDGLAPYVIPMGGSSALGVVGYVNAALEMAETDADVVYVGGGTLGTAVGLALGFAAVGARTRVEAIRVTPAELANPAVAAQLAYETSALLAGLDDAFPALGIDDLHLTVRDDFFEPGYGVVTPETLDALRQAERIGLHLETTYTGKAFSAMLADAAAGKLAGERVIFVDTYNSAPYPPAGDEALLPETLREYIAECRRLFPEA